MKLNEKIKKIIAGTAGIILIAVAVIWFMQDGLEHIEDTNGAENYDLQTITDANIINRDVGAMGLQTSTDAITNTVTYSSKKFTGVEEIYGENIAANRMEFTINHASVTEGNFKIVLLVDDEIVHEFKLNELTQTYILEKPSGYVSLRVAGESANFMFDYHIM
ncbi:MAG: hypothetical protein IKB93_16695 [Clostridia bacterium]|nr:hypothetical protein [Clostridia bacterium]